MINLDDKRDVENVIFEINTSQNIERKQDIDDGHRIFRGDLRHYVEKRLAQLWPKTHKYFRMANASITKKVVDAKSKAYQEAPIRLLDNEQETTKYKELSDKFMLDKAMQLFDEINNLDHYGAMWVNLVTERKDGTTLPEPVITFRALNQSQFDRVVNKHTLETELMVVSVPHNLILEQIHGDSMMSIIQDESEDRDNLAFYAMWTPTQHRVIAFNKRNESIIPLIVKGNEEGINPLGAIPFVFLQNGDILDVPTRPSLPMKDIELNSCKSVLLTGCDLQALGKLIISHPAGQAPPDSVYDSPFTHLSLPQSQDEGSPATTANFITPDTNVSDFKEVVQDFERSAIEEEGISVESIGDANFSSGTDRIVANQSTKKIIELNQRDYARVEESIYQLVKLHMESMGDFTFKSDRLVVQYPKPTPMQSRMELLAEIEKEMELGTIESWEKHIKLNPNLSEEEAREKEDRIQLSKMSVMQSFMSPAPVVDEEDADIER